MNLAADLQNDSNWQQVYTEEREVVYDAAGGYTALPAFEIPFTFEGQIIAIRALSKNAKFTWNFAGKISQRIQLGGGATPLPVATQFEQNLRINRSTLLVLSKLTTEYELLFEPFYWIKHINLTIWEYIGTAEEVTNEALVRIEGKIDDIAAYGT